MTIKISDIPAEQRYGRIVFLGADGTRDSIARIKGVKLWLSGYGRWTPTTEDGSCDYAHNLIYSVPIDLNAGLSEPKWELIPWGGFVQQWDEVLMRGRLGWCLVGDIPNPIDQHILAVERKYGATDFNPWAYRRLIQKPTHNTQDSTKMSSVTGHAATKTFPRFWMVSKGGDVLKSSKRHMVFAEAVSEAKRLSEKENCKFMVLESVAETSPPDPRKAAFEKLADYIWSEDMSREEVFNAGWNAAKKQ